MEMLTAMCISRPSMRQRRPCSSALVRMVRVSASMSPCSSAMWMNRAGATRPSSGCCQRTRVSTPVTSPSESRTLG
jgi:hypothetical protein